jgi:hypothetical protein
MNFDPCNRPLKIQKSIRIPTPKVGAHLGVWRFIFSHFPTLLGAWNLTPELHSWPASFQALALVTSPRRGLKQKEPQINLPKKFDGTCSKFRGFIIQLHQHCYPNDQTRVGIIDTLLSSIYLTWFVPFLKC